ncbi:MAG: DUF1624 domain-containing protein [Oscillospiraceae bacterium]|nr:DUF1624 domain-containing protein [Oscillospiraceae bacterium]
MRIHHQKPELFLSKPNSGRCAVLDFIRGFTVLHMIAFHACWDLVYLFGQNWTWYHGTGAYIWQQGICWTFILLSGFCAGMSRHPFRRGLTIFLAGMMISGVTILFMPENLILFGVLTCIGSCMLILAIPGCRDMLRNIPAVLGILLSFCAFALTKSVNSGYLGFFSMKFLKLPAELYQNYLTAYLGFPQNGFYSTDYFALFPWIFLFLTGFFIYQACHEKILKISWNGFAPVNFIGRHALEIYILHQPVIYAILYLFFKVI